MGASILLAAVVLLAPPIAKLANSSSTDLKGYHEYSREMKTALRAEALAQKQIVYFAPRRALVVRATDDFHHDLNGVLNAMRAAGR